MSDVTIQICDFKTRSKSAGKLIDKPSVEKVLASDKFKTSLKMGRILGLATHKSRYEIADPNIPMEDQILTSPYLANCARKIWIDNSKETLMGEFDLLNTTYGNLIKDMLRKGIMIPVSMSVSATADNDKYYVDDLLGVDFTERPDLNASIQKVNFSEADLSDVTYDKDGKHYISFSAMLTTDTCKFSESEVITCPECGQPIDECVCVAPGIRREGKCHSESNSPRPTVTPSEKIDIAKVQPVINTAVPEDNPVITNLNDSDTEDESEDMSNFASMPLCSELGITPGTDLTTTMAKIHEGINPENQLSLNEIATLDYKISHTNFTVSFLNQYVRELGYMPSKVMKVRVDDVIQICRKLRQEEIDSKSKNLRKYIDEYLYSRLQAAMDNPKVPNLGIELRLTSLGAKSQKLSKLTNILKRVRDTVKKLGVMTTPQQKELANSYNSIKEDIYRYINSKIAPKVLWKPEDEKDEKK